MSTQELIAEIEKQFPALDRRRDDRRSVSTPVLVEPQPPAAVTPDDQGPGGSITLDLSAGGLSYISDGPLTVGAAVHITFLDVRSKPIYLGIVRHSAPLAGRYFRTGIEFVPQPQH